MGTYRTGNSFSDTRAGTGNAELAQSIRAITVGTRRRAAGRLLSPAEDREAFGAERLVASRLQESSSAEAAGIASPLTEQPYSGESWYTLTSSDGLLVLEFPSTTRYTDAAGRNVEVVHLDPAVNYSAP